MHIFDYANIYIWLCKDTGAIYRARKYEYTHEMEDENAYSVKWICVFDDVKTRN